MNLLKIVLVCFLASGLCVNALADDAFIARDGRTFTVAIDGVLTARTADRDLRDSSTVSPYTTQWAFSSAKGPHCIRITPKDSRLGQPERIDVLIHEIASDQPFQQWRDYSLVPPTLENTGKFLEGEGFCVKEYSLTDRLHFPSLPNGEYVVQISFWGVGNWDRQTILLKVTDSGVNKNPEPQATALPNVASGECDIATAAQRNMALHGQLEDMAARGEVSRDIFRTFADDTKDFGDLYVSNPAEICRRLDALKVKYKVK